MHSSDSGGAPPPERCDSPPLPENTVHGTAPIQMERPEVAPSRRSLVRSNKGGGPVRLSSLAFGGRGSAQVAPTFESTVVMGNTRTVETSGNETAAFTAQEYQVSESKGDVKAERVSGYQSPRKEDGKPKDVKEFQSPENKPVEPVDLMVAEVSGTASHSDSASSRSEHHDEKPTVLEPSLFHKSGAAVIPIWMQDYIIEDDEAEKDGVRSGGEDDVENEVPVAQRVSKRRVWCRRIWKLSKTIAKLLTMLLLLVAVILAFVVFPMDEYLADFLEFVDTLGWWGPVIYAAFLTPWMLLCMVPSWLWLGSGFLFGFWVGVVASWVGTSLGMFFCFVLARTLGRGFVKWYAARQPIFKAIEHAVRRHSFKVTVLVRFTVLPAQNYILALTSVSAGKYNVGSSLAIIPGVVLSVYLGTTLQSIGEIFESSSSPDPNSVMQLILFILMILVTVLIGVALAIFIKQAVKKIGTENSETKMFQPPAKDPLLFRVLSIPDRITRWVFRPWYDLLENKKHTLWVRAINACW